MRIDLTVDIEPALRYLKDIEKNVVPRAAAATINKVAVSARAEAVRQIARETGIPQAEVRKRIDIVGRASKYKLEAVITARPWSPNLIRFKAREVRQGVAASAWRKRKVYKGAFIGNKGRTVFARTSKDRLPIKPLRGPSVRVEFLRGYALKAMQRKIDERFNVEFERAMAQFLRTRR
jgi:hypothetical protein